MSITVCPDLHDIPEGYFLTGCAVSGGTLEDFLCSAMEISQGRLCVKLEIVSNEFPLPCPQGLGTKLSKEELSNLLTQYSFHFSEKLCTNYLTFIQEDRVKLVLYDTPESILRKYHLLCALKVPYVWIPDRSLRQLITK